VTKRDFEKGVHARDGDSFPFNKVVERANINKQ
jgi:hypothetical protein